MAPIPFSKTGPIRAHTFMTSTKNDQFYDTPPPPFTKMNNESFFQNKIQNHVKISRSSLNPPSTWMS